jgi:hypothetical protein
MGLRPAPHLLHFPQIWVFSTLYTVCPTFMKTTPVIWTPKNLKHSKTGRICVRFSGHDLNTRQVFGLLAMNRLDLQTVSSSWL